MKKIIDYRFIEKGIFRKKQILEVLIEQSYYDVSLTWCTCTYWRLATLSEAWKFLQNRTEKISIDPEK